MTAHPPTEPPGPSPQGEHLSRTWLGAWLAAAAIGGIVLVVLWVRDARVEVLAAVGTVVALAMVFVLHHVVVTQDAGERHVARPDSRGADLPARLPRRHVMAGLGALVVVGGAALAGVLGFGRTPPRGTSWEDGRTLRTITGRRLRPDDVPVGGVVTVWPDGAVGAERPAVMLIRLREPPEAPTNLDGVADRTLVAYSRLCTHAGCAVALYRDRDQALFCPCHQATFSARQGARPTSGPASAPLPQLPIGVDEAGYLVATADLSARPGPLGGRTSA